MDAALDRRDVRGRTCVFFYETGSPFVARSRPSCPSVMPVRRSSIRLALVFSVLLLAGCTASKLPEPIPGVEAARNARWAVVPLSVADTVVADYRRVSEHAAVARAVPPLLDAAGQAFRLIGDPAMEAPVTLQNVYRRTESRGENSLGLAPRPAAFDSLQAVSGCRYVLTLHAIQWSKTGRRIVAERSVSALSAVASFATGYEELFVLPSGPSDETVVGVSLVDVRDRSVIAEGTVATPSAEVDAAVQSALIWLLTGRRLSPESLGVDVSDDVIVYRTKGEAIVGTGFSVDGLEAVVQRADREPRRVPIQSVTKVKSTSRNRAVFPVDR